MFGGACVSKIAAITLFVESTKTVVILWSGFTVYLGYYTDRLFEGGGGYIASVHRIELSPLLSDPDVIDIGQSEDHHVMRLEDLTERSIGANWCT